MMDVEGVDCVGGGNGGGAGGINGPRGTVEGEEVERMPKGVSGPVPMSARSYLAEDDNMTPGEREREGGYIPPPPPLPPPASLETPIGSSQESTWTQYTMSSQDELPESLQLSHDWTATFADKHQLLDFGARVNVQLPTQFKAAAEFCKMSGLLCSYGLYQVTNRQ